MAEYLSPGVYIEESAGGARPIEGVSTATAAFIGFAPAGDENKMVLITSWSQYVKTFGVDEPGGLKNPHLKDAYLSHAVYGYFNNGGSRCYVMRIGANSAAAVAPKRPSIALPSRSNKNMPSLTLTAKALSPADITVEVAPFVAEGATEGAFTLKVNDELFENIVVGRPPRGSTARSVVEAVASSRFVEVLEGSVQGSLAERMPEVGSYVLRAPAITAGGTIDAAQFKGDVIKRSGLEGFEIKDDVTMLCVPDLMSPLVKDKIDAKGVIDVQKAMIAHAERMQDRIAILDPMPNLTPQDVLKWRNTDANFDSAFAALYYPWIEITGPDGESLSIPPCGHVAGIWARNDTERGVHKAPANEVVRGVLEPSLAVTTGEQDTLNPAGINCIRSFTGRGVRIWGARTLANTDARWRYINVRRLFNYVEKSIERGTQWVVFEPNDVFLWDRVRRDINAFLTGVWRDGALFGASTQQAFFVKCDEELNPADVRDRGQLLIEVGIAPVKPAEFVIFRFQQYAGGGA
jgi:uncharacterized protein